MRCAISFLMAVEDNLPWTQIGPAAMPDSDDITGPNSRQHTCSSDAQARFARRARNFTH